MAKARRTTTGEVTDRARFTGTAWKRLSRGAVSGPFTDVGLKLWAPSPEEWNAIHKELPKTADLRRFDQEVSLGAWLYLGIERSDLSDWKQVIKTLEQADRELSKVLVRLRTNHSDRSNRIAVLSYRNFTRAFTMDLRDRTVRPTQALLAERRELLYANLLAACTEPGGLPLHVSDNGPLNRTMSAILKLVLPKPPTARSVKAIIFREKERRAEGIGVGGIRLR
jgi:hypothetical protein